jgi:hypothetical protein
VRINNMLDIDAVLLLPRDRPNLARGAGLEPSARSAGKFKVWTGPFLAGAAFSHYQRLPHSMRPFFSHYLAVMSKADHACRANSIAALPRSQAWPFSKWSSPPSLPLVKAFNQAPMTQQVLPSGLEISLSPA